MAALPARAAPPAPDDDVRQEAKRRHDALIRDGFNFTRGWRLAAAVKGSVLAPCDLDTARVKEIAERLYAERGLSARFVLYPGAGHEVTEAMAADIEKFFQEAERAP